MPAANLHLTLAFLGAVERGAIEGLERALATAFVDRDPLTLRAALAGTFPPGRGARVAWIGLEALSGDLSELQRAAVEAASAALGASHPAAVALAAESRRRGFHPHVSLARAAEPWPRSAAERFVAAWSDLGDPSTALAAPFVVANGALFESHLGGGPPRYQALARLPLRRSDG